MWCNPFLGWTWPGELRVSVFSDESRVVQQTDTFLLEVAVPVSVFSDESRVVQPNILERYEDSITVSVFSDESRVVQRRYCLAKRP